MQRVGAVFLTSLVVMGAACVAPQEQQSGAGEAGPQYGGQLTTSIVSDPYDWDPSYQGKSSPNNESLALAYDSLLGFKSEPGIEYTEVVLQPALAERWSVSDDARTFTFTLRRGVKFGATPPTNGRELTAADVRWTLAYRVRSEEFKEKKLPADQLGFMFEGLEQVETPDPYTVRVSFKDAYVPFINYAASQWNPVLAREIFEQDGHFKDRIAGAGPFMLATANSEKGTRWVWKKNPGYWDTGKPYVDEIRQVVTPAEATAFAAFQARQIDLLEGLSHQAFQTVSRGSPQADTYKYHGVQSSYLFLSQAKAGPLTDIRVRRAIDLTVDRDELNRLVAGGEGLWALPGVMPGTFTAEETQKALRRDPEEAKRLLAQAGHGSGLDLSWPITNDETQANLAAYQLLQAQLKRVGINVTLNVLDRTEQRLKRRAGDFDLDYSTSSTASLNMDVDSWVYGRYQSASSGNYSKVKDPELDGLLEASRRESGAAKRVELQRKAALRIHEMVWTVNLLYEPAWSVVHSHVKNYHPWFSDYAPYAQSWIQR